MSPPFLLFYEKLVLSIAIDVASLYVIIKLCSRMDQILIADQARWIKTKESQQRRPIFKIIIRNNEDIGLSKALGLFSSFSIDSVIQFNKKINFRKKMNGV